MTASILFGVQRMWRSILLIVAIVVVGPAGVFAVRPIRVVVVRDGQVQRDAELTYGTKTSTQAGVSYWTMPYWRFLYLSLTQSPSSGTAIVSPAESAIQVAFERVDVASLPPDIARLFKSTLDSPTSSTNDATLLRMINSERTLSELRLIEMSLGEVELQIESEGRFQLHQRAPLTREVPTSVSYLGTSSDGRVVDMVWSGTGLYVRFDASRGPAAIRSLDGSTDLYVMWRPKQADPTAGVPGTDINDVAGRPCAVALSTAMKAAATSVDEAGEGQATVGDDAVSTSIKVLLVTSPALRGIKREGFDKLLIKMKEFANQLVQHVDPRVRIDWQDEPFDAVVPMRTEMPADSEADIGLWDVARALVATRDVDAELVNARENRRYRQIVDTREFAGVDIVVFLSAAPKEYGCGQVASIGADPERAFALVNVTCNFETALAHELAHLMGARHELYDDSGGELSAHATRWPNWESPKDWHGTITSVGSVKRIPYFSDAEFSCDGEQIGNRGDANQIVLVRARVAGGLVRPRASVSVSGAPSGGGKADSGAGHHLPIDANDNPSSGLTGSEGPSAAMKDQHDTGPVSTVAAKAPDLSNTKPVRPGKGIKAVVDDAVVEPNEIGGCAYLSTSGQRCERGSSFFFSPGKSRWISRKERLAADESRQRVLEVLKSAEGSQVRVLVFGYADESGSEAENFALSVSRAQHVARFLDIQQDSEMVPEVAYCAYGKQFRYCDGRLSRWSRRERERRVDVVVLPAEPHQP